MPLNNCHYRYLPISKSSSSIIGFYSFLCVQDLYQDFIFVVFSPTSKKKGRFFKEENLFINQFIKKCFEVLEELKMLSNLSMKRVHLFVWQWLTTVFEIICKILLFDICYHPLVIGRGIWDTWKLHTHSQFPLQFLQEKSLERVESGKRLCIGQTLLFSVF